MMSASPRSQRGRLLARCFVAGGLFLTTLATVTLGIDVVPALAEGGASPLASSAVTVNWADGITDADGNVTPRDTTDPNYSNFQNIQVTVSQTQNLTYQGVEVSWKNARQSSGVQFAQNFMQIMQCWSDDPRTCQFGAPTAALATKSGFRVQSRDIVPLLDPRQAGDLSDDMISGYDLAGDPMYAFPFVSAGSGESTFDVRQLFSSTSSNEVGAAPTGADGSGMVNFEVQTSLESRHLGCGLDDGYGSGAPCYLVFVPRGELNLDGNPLAEASGLINGSPLSLSAWRNRIVVPLNFAPVSVSCPLGQQEVRVVGNDLISKAFSSWQPALCQTGATYGFSRIGDDEARHQITSTGLGASHIGVVSGAMKGSDLDAAGIDYAPVAQSALVVAFNIDYALASDSPLYALKNGTKVRDLRLNQRLIAKLLTQSYREDNPGAGFGNTVVQANPRALTVDPEFVALNPDFATFNRVYPQGLFVPFGNSDVYQHVWQWVIANPDAKAFIDGTPDPWGMTVNPTYQALGLTTGEAPPNFPKTELRTYSVDPANIPAYGSLELRPYFNSLDETATRILRADGNVKSSFDTLKPPAPGQYVASPPQTIGQRFSIGITDMASAVRFGLDIASLQGTVTNNFVYPTESTVEKAIDSWTPVASNGVATPTWSVPVSDAYPLSEMAYAAVSICYATNDERVVYRELIRWMTATDGGQVQGDAPGQMPRGYFPISDAQRAQVNTALADLSDPQNKATRCAKPSKSLFGSGARSSSGLTGSSDSSDDDANSGANLFIRAPYYGTSASGGGDPVMTRILTAGGYIAGIPLAIAGLIMQRNSRTLPSGRRRGF
jgi:hypothetical protein